LQAYHLSAQSAQFHFLWRDHPASSAHQLARSGCLDLVAYRLMTDPQFPPHRRDRLTFLYPLNSQFLELCRECLLRYLFHVPSSNLRVILTSPLEDEISGEAQNLGSSQRGQEAYKVKPRFQVTLTPVVGGPIYGRLSGRSIKHCANRKTCSGKEFGQQRGIDFAFSAGYLD